jgi:hypothetical protein
MVLVIIQDMNGKLRVEEIDHNDWFIMTTARRWHKEGDWKAITEYVYRHGLHKSKTEKSKKKGLLSRVFR